MSKEVWLVICWFTCWRKREFHAYRWPNPCCFTSSVLLFLEPLMTPLINWGHVLFQTMNKHNPQNSLHLSLPMNTALQEENSFPETHSHHSELLPYKQMDFQGGSGLAESLNLCSARQRTKGEIFKDKADKIKLLEYLWVWSPIGVFQKLPPQQDCFPWHRMAQLTNSARVNFR